MIVPGMRVRVYYNLRRGDWSVVDRTTRRVAAHTARVILATAQLHVSLAGQRRCRAEGRRNVHAWVEGTVAAAAPEGPAMRFSYDPYRDAGFVRASDRMPLPCHLATAIFTPAGAYAQEAN